METNMYLDAAGLEKKELRRSSSIVGFGLLIMYALSFGVYIGLYLLINLLFPAGLDEAAYDIADNVSSLIAYMISFIVPIAFITMWFKLPAGILMPMKTPNASITFSAVFFCLGCTVIGVMLAEAVSSAIRQVFGVVPVMPDFSIPSGMVSFAVYCVSVVIAPAFLEEFLFRGVIMQSLRRFGDNFALIVSSILFAMAHGNLVQGPNTLVLGMAIGFFVMRTGSLWTGVIIHFANNGIAVAIDLLLTYEVVPEEFINTAFMFIYVFAAAAAFIYLIRTYPGFFRFPVSNTNLSEGRKYSSFFISVAQILLLIATIAITAQFFEPMGYGL